MSEYHNLSGEKKDQLLILTDTNGKQIGQASREVCHSGLGRTHMAFTAFIINSKGEILLTKRSRNKSLWPDFWDAPTVSHVLPGETPEIAARRRGEEELGMDVAFKNIGAFYYAEKFKENSENEYCHILVGKSDRKIDFNPVEIENIRNISLEDLKKEIKNHPEFFTPWLKLALENIKKF